MINHHKNYDSFELSGISTSKRTSSPGNNLVVENILQEIKNSHASKKNVRVIFDIDSTLFDTSYRTGAIFKEFARHTSHCELWPELCADINRWEDTVEVYDPIDFLNHHGNWHVDRQSDLGKYLMKFWRKRFFHDDWLSHDLPYRGAREFVSSCQSMGASICYLTGREHCTLFQATLRMLSIHGFPLESRNEKYDLLLKESKKIADLAYKDEGLRLLSEGFDDVYFIDNEVELVLMALENHPDIHTYLFDSVHSGRASKESHIANVIESWAVDLKKTDT